jgi:radical SAM protein with 4Fe4S-binding SPASM domain
MHRLISGFKKVSPLAGYLLHSLSLNGQSLPWLRLRQVAKKARLASFDPPLPLRLQVETTDFCNFKCVMCARENLDGMNSCSLSLERFLDLLDEVKPLYVTLNGLGEPLMDKTIFQKLAALHERNVVTSMPTNGSLLRGANLEKLAQHLPNRLCCSIDGATKDSFEKIRKNSKFEDVITNYYAIDALKAEGQTPNNTSIHILCALQKKNLYDYAPMYELFSRFRTVNTFSLVPVFNFGNDDCIEELIPSHEEIYQLHKDIDRAISESVDERQREFFRKWRHVSSQWLTVDGQLTHDTHPNSNPCLVPWFSTYVDAKGRVYPCCYLPTSEHVMGNIHENDMATIWKGERYREFRRCLTQDRPNLPGCNTCPRDDTAILELLNKFRFTLL